MAGQSCDAGRSMALPGAERKRLLGKIHIAKKQLGLSEDNYRVLLGAVTGKSSCAEMDGAELQAVLQEFVARGFKVGASQSIGGAAPKPPARGMGASPLRTPCTRAVGEALPDQLESGNAAEVPHTLPPTSLRYQVKDLSPIQGKVLALWCEGKRLGLIRGGDRALDKFVKRQTGVERLPWLTEMQAASVIEALKGMIGRVDEQLDDFLSEGKKRRG